MDTSTLALVWLSLAVLLPMVPAFLLFTYLQSTGAAEATIMGVKVSLSGSVAAYFVVFWIVWNGRPTEDIHYHTWTVTGMVDVVPAPGEPEPNINDIVVRAVPPRLAVLNGGVFAFDIPVVEDAKGRLLFPDLQLDLRGYRGRTIALTPGRVYGAEDLQITHDADDRSMVIAAPIKLTSSKIGPQYVGGVPAVPLGAPAPDPATAAVAVVP